MQIGYSSDYLNTLGRLSRLHCWLQLLALVHLLLGAEALTLGVATLGALVSGAGTPTPFLKIFPIFGTNLLGFGCETPTPGTEAFAPAPLHATVGPLTFTSERCAALAGTAEKVTASKTRKATASGVDNATPA
jgi:hypothetical protein